jgi:hypothetical protein
MSKKHRKQKRQANEYGYAFGQPPQTNGYGYPPPYGGWQAGFDPATGMPREHHAHGFDHDHTAGYGAGNFGPGGFDRDFLRQISSFLPGQHTDQFLLGLMIGAGAAWVLGDEEIRGKLIKAAMKVYAGVAGGFEEFKEQMADIKAEVATERHGDE